MKGLLRCLIPISLMFAVSCKQDSQPVADTQEETSIFVPEPVYRWGICIDSLDVVDGTIGRNELLSTDRKSVV